MSNLNGKQHWRVETDGSGLLARVWLVNDDGSETRIENVYGFELSGDANRRNENQQPVQLTIRVVGDVEARVAESATRFEQVSVQQWVDETMPPNRPVLKIDLTAEEADALRDKWQLRYGREAAE